MGMTTLLVIAVIAAPLLAFIADNIITPRLTEKE